MAYQVNFCETKEQLKHLAEVVTGKAEGSPTGADIDTSTLTYAGLVRNTLPELLSRLGWYSVGEWSTDPLISSDNQYVLYNGIRYAPLSIPYQVDSTANPDPETLVGTELKVITDVTSVDLTEAQEELLPVGSRVYPKDGALQNGQSVPSGTTHLRILVGGKPTIVAMSTIATGLVSGLTDTSVDIGGNSVIFKPISTELHFSTVDDLKSGIGAPKYALGSVDVVAKTKSYHGGYAVLLTPVGGSSYFLTTLQKARDTLLDPTWEPDGYGDHYLFGGNQYVALLDRGTRISPTQYGAYGDGISLDGNAINAMHESLNYYSGGITVDGQNLTYVIETKNVKIENCSNLTFENFNYVCHSSMPITYGHRILDVQSCTNVVFQNLILDANRAERGIAETSCYNLVVYGGDGITIDNVKAINAVTDGFLLSSAGGTLEGRPRNVTMTNCRADNCARQGMTIGYGVIVSIDNCEFKNTNGIAPEAGIDVEPNVLGVIPSVETLSITNTLFEGNRGAGLTISAADSPTRTTVDGCTFKNNYKQALNLYGENIAVNACWFLENNQQQVRGIIDIGAEGYAKNISIENCVFSDFNHQPTTYTPCIFLSSVAGDDEQIESFVFKNIKFYNSNELRYTAIQAESPVKIEDFRMYGMKANKEVISITAADSLLRDIYFDNCQYYGINISPTATDCRLENINFKNHVDNASHHLLRCRGEGMSLERLTVKNDIAISNYAIDSSVSYNLIDSCVMNDCGGLNLTGDAATEAVGYFRSNIVNGVRVVDN